MFADDEQTFVGNILPLRQARSQDFVMGGLIRGLGAKSPAAEDWGSSGKAPSRRMQGGLGAELPALGDFYDFSTRITHF